jgi:hypothetical protein
MLRQHIACQQGGQVARPLLNKCRDRAAQRPYVRLRPLAYIMGNKPHGSIGSPPERGAQVHRIKPGHVSVPDPCLGQGTPCPGTSLWVAWTLPGGIQTPSKGPNTLTWESWTVFWGSGLCVQGSGASSWRSGPTDCILGYIIFSGHVAPLEPSTWWGQVLLTARLEIAAWTPWLHTVVRGTPDLGYRQWPLGPPQGREQACRWGQSFDWRLARCFHALAVVITACSRQLSRLSLWLTGP